MPSSRHASRSPVLWRELARPALLPTEAEAEAVAEAYFAAFLASYAARASQGHIGRARALARDESTRNRRREVVSYPAKLTSLGACTTAAANLAEVTKEEADRSPASSTPATRPISTWPTAWWSAVGGRVNTGRRSLPSSGGSAPAPSGAISTWWIGG